jgi:methionyl-tRNA formyltransferase
MKLVFAGSPAFAVPTLERLAQAHDIRSVVTQPDRPVGRKQELQPPPVKEAALRLNLPVFQPEKIKSDESRALLQEIQPDCVVVVGYGQILPPWLLEMPRFGCINLHASLLPAYRGAAPIQWSVANGETTTGLTTMLMDPGLDTGPILLQWTTQIGPEETAVELAERMSTPGADLIAETLERLQAGTVTPQPQDHSRASRAPLLKKEHGLIDWSLSAQQIANRVRGLLPWPGCYTGFRGKKLQVWRARPYQSRERERPGVAFKPGQLLLHSDSLFVACGQNTSLQLLELQLEGRRRVTAAEFLHGAQIQSAEHLQSEPFK